MCGLFRRHREIFSGGLTVARRARPDTRKNLNEPSRAPARAGDHDLHSGEAVPPAARQADSNFAPRRANPTEVVMIRLEHVLCAVDFSHDSRHAFDRAVGIARCYDAKISVLHVVPQVSLAPVVALIATGAVPYAYEPVDRERIGREIRDFLGIDDSLGVPVEYQIVEAQLIPGEIVAQAEALAPDLLVIGTHGRSGFNRLMLGSVAERVLRTSRVPVVTVPPRAPDVVPLAGQLFRRILYATDFSPGSDVALDYAASLAQRASGHLTTVHVVETLRVVRDPSIGSFDVSGYYARLEQDAKKQLASVVPEHVRAGCETCDVVTLGKPYVEILRLARERQIDLIVMGVHGRSAVDRLVFGSTTEHIVRRAACPVLTVRTPEHGH
jgi:nucleotide-binding universal stress UspA family protein